MSRTMWEYLPPEIEVEILHRLPTKSLLRFRSVCKAWRSLIVDPSFISFHRRHSHSFFLLQLIQVEPLNSLINYCSLHHDDPLLTDSNSSLPLPGHDYSIKAVCHGLLLCLKGDDLQSTSLVICNPAIRRFLSLPKPIHYEYPFVPTIVFGFDSQNNDYKIVRIACNVDDERNRHSALVVEVFSLASKSWRILFPAVTPVCSIAWLGRGFPNCFVNGLVHWGARRWVGEGGHAFYFFVLSFNFGDELFQEVLLPDCLAYASSNTARVTVVGGGNEKALSVYHLIIGDFFYSGSIWVMKEYGVVESWTKLFAFDLRSLCMEAPSFEMAINPPLALWVRNNREILLATMERKTGHMYLVDAERRRFVQIQIAEENFNWWFLYAGYYAESLALLNNINDLVSY